LKKVAREKILIVPNVEWFTQIHKQPKRLKKARRFYLQQINIIISSTLTKEKRIMGNN
jgi:hypothetical protein